MVPEAPLEQTDAGRVPAGEGWFAHVIVAAGADPCTILAVGSRTAPRDAWGAYPVDETALRHGAGVERGTSDQSEAYARFPDPVPTRLPDGLLS